MELSVAFLDCNALSAFSAVLSIALAFSAVQFSNMYFKYNAFKLSPVYKNPVQSTPSPCNAVIFCVIYSVSLYC